MMVTDSFAAATASRRASSSSSSARRSRRRSVLTLSIFTPTSGSRARRWLVTSHRVNPFTARRWWLMVACPRPLARSRSTCRLSVAASMSAMVFHPAFSPACLMRASVRSVCSGVLPFAVRNVR
ncbi:MAG: hypothetical protein AB7Q00_15750 [Phycisphaerales bacterium]